MCGLYGYNIKKWDNKITNLMALLAIFNEDRGNDAFGWSNGKVIVKEGIEITRGFDEIPFEGEKVGAFHTRAGTSGPKDAKDCAHPWLMEGKAGKIIGMHNGFVNNYWQLQRKYDNVFPVDSMQLVAATADGRDYDDIEFSGVFIYFQNGKGPFMFKTGSRDIDVVMLKNKAGIVWSSDWCHLRRALSMSKVAIDHVYALPDENRLYEFSAEGMLRYDQKIQTAKVPIKFTPKVDHSMSTFYKAVQDRVGDDLWDGQVIPRANMPIPSNISRPSKQNFARVESIGQWRKLFGEKEESWVVCYHSGKVRITTMPDTYSCGCSESKLYSKSWPTLWRPVGEWIGNTWRECWHTLGNKSCICTPFSNKDKPKALPPAQTEGNVGNN